MCSNGVKWALKCLISSATQLHVEKLILQQGNHLSSALLAICAGTLYGTVWYRDTGFDPMPPHLLPHIRHLGAISVLLNTLRPRQNGRHFADDTFKCIFLNENVRILIKISLKYVPKGPIDNIPALVHIMAWRQPGDKPLSESMMVRSPTHKNASLGLNELRCLIDIHCWYIKGMRSVFRVFNQSDIWQASWQHSWWAVCQISKWYVHFNSQSHGLEALWYLQQGILNDIEIPPAHKYYANHVLLYPFQNLHTYIRM